jgi:hypothetical protein
MQVILELPQGLSHAGVEPLYSAATRFARADFNVQTNNGFP